MFGEMLRKASSAYPVGTALRLGEDRLGYRELYERSCRLANLLQENGIRPGEVVASLGRNQLSSLEEFGATALGGFIRTPLFLQDAPSRQADMLKRVGASVLIVDAAPWQRLTDALQPTELAALRLVLVKGEGYEEQLAASRQSDPQSLRDPESTYIVRFSAGTTGMPKPIAHSERAYCLANEEVLASTPPLQADDVYLAVSPYSHASGNMVWPFVKARASHVLLQGGFDAHEALRLIERWRVTTLFLVPTMIQRLLDAPEIEQADLSSLRRIIYGAAPIPQHLIKRALERFGSILSQSYGQSEIVPLTCLPPSDHCADGPAAARLASAGRTTAHTAVRIEAPDGSLLGIGEVGEIVGQSPGAMQGIFGDPEATAARLTADGWVRTGDLGRLDEDGYIYVIDRMDDVIISGGFNIAPAEIEDALIAHDAVAEAAVFGVEDAMWGATPIAVVRLHCAGEVNAQELDLWCRERVGAVKKPSAILFVDEPLPVNGAGKVMRRVLRERYRARQTGDGSVQSAL
jgi:acyl-CoA synthetase (AMP-forming)/AMP-acid ligase II